MRLYSIRQVVFASLIPLRLFGWPLNSNLARLGQQGQVGIPTRLDFFHPVGEHSRKPVFGLLGRFLEKCFLRLSRPEIRDLCAESCTNMGSIPPNSNSEAVSRIVEDGSWSRTIHGWSRTIHGWSRTIHGWSRTIHGHQGFTLAKDAPRHGRLTSGGGATS